MFTDSGSQEHIYGSCHIQTEFVEDRLCLGFDILISSNIQICGCHSEHLHSSIVYVENHSLPTHCHYASWKFSVKMHQNHSA